MPAVWRLRATTPQQFGSAALSGSGGLSVSASILVAANATMPGAGGLAASPTQILVAIPATEYSGQIKPTGVPTIDWTNSLTASLIFYGIDTGQGSIVDLVGGRMMTSTGSITTDSGPFGSGFDYPGGSSGNSTGFASDSTIDNATASPPWTIACAAIQNGSSGNGFALFTRSANNAGSQPYLNWSLGSPNPALVNFQINNGGSLAYVGTSYAVSTGPFFSFGGVALSASTAAFYADGIQSGSTSTGLSIQSLNTQDPLVFGSNSPVPASSHNWAGWIPYGAFWNRALSSGELASIHANPYSFIAYPWWAGSGALAVDGFPAQFAAASFAGTGSLVAGASIPIFGVAAFNGAGGLAADSIIENFASAAFNGTGGLSNAASLDIVASAAFAGSGGLATNGIVENFASAIFAGAGGLADKASLLIVANASMPGAGGLAVDGYPTQFDSISLAGAGGLAVSASVIEIATASFAGSGGLAVSAFLLSM